MISEEKFGKPLYGVEFHIRAVNRNLNSRNPFFNQLQDEYLRAEEILSTSFLNKHMYVTDKSYVLPGSCGMVQQKYLKLDFSNARIINCIGEVLKGKREIDFSDIPLEVWFGGITNTLENALVLDKDKHWMLFYRDEQTSED